MESEDFRRCVAFHGHICPGLSIGYRAAMAGMAWLAARRAEDEEIVAIVENDACAVDAVQVITGCTFGKGNFIHKDYGKMAFTLLSRDTGRGVRIMLHGETARPDEEHIALIRKVIAGEISDEEQERFQHLHLQRSRRVLEAPLDELFTIREIRSRLPDKASIEPSLPCARCGEPTMKTKLEESDGGLVCRGCLAAE
jgi:formylmethanofuran dehydrogenase subunit E